jgi:hypothetical protein
MSGNPTYQDLTARSDDKFRLANHLDTTTVMVDIRQHPQGRGERSTRYAVAWARKLTGRFSMKHSRSPLFTSFFERCIMKNFGKNSARILASPKERYAQKNRSAQ